MENTEDIQNLYVQLVEIPGINGFNILFLIGVVEIVSLLVLRKKLKPKF